MAIWFLYIRKISPLAKTGITELIPFGAINADEVLCIDSVGSVWGVLDLTSWVPRKIYYHLYGGDLYTAIENMIKGKVEETITRP